MRNGKLVPFLGHLIGKVYKKIFFFLGASCTLFFAVSAQALPTGGAGINVTITHPNANTLQIIQTQPRAIINWSSFNLNGGQQVIFTQPNSSSIALNKIDPAQGVSNIAGSIYANGQIVLINPAGIYFAPSANVNIAGIIATTANLRNDQEFLAGGPLRFEDISHYNGSIINDGNIVVRNAGLAALVGNGVVNNGYIQANMGTVILGASRKFTIDFNGDQLIQFLPGGNVTDARDQNGNRLKDAITNNGKISVNGGRVMMTSRTAGQILDRSINMNGIVEAKTVAVKDGVIILDAIGGKVKVSGKLIATGKNKNEHGGQVKVLADEIVLDDHANIDVSGDVGGGEILIGGNAHGAGTEYNATRVFVGPHVNLNASAIRQGDGGKVVVWSNDDTRFYGNIYSRGGAEYGDGGWVETSGKEYLDAQGMVDASARNGNSGLWLLDPRNVTVSAATVGGTYLSGVFTPTANNATVAASSIQGTLNGGSNVTITAGSTGTQAGTITVANAITKSSGGDATLTFESGTLSGTPGNIIINASAGTGITSSAGKLNVVFTNATGRAGTVTISAPISTNGGDITDTSTTLNINSPINTSGGNFTIDNSANVTVNSTITTGGGNITNTSSALTINNTINTSGGNFTSNTSNATSLAVVISPSTTIGSISTGAGKVTLNVNTDGAGANSFSMGANGSNNTFISTTSTAADAVSIHVNAAAGTGTGSATLRGISVGSGGGITVATDTGGSTFGGDITFPNNTLLLDTGTTGTVNLSTPQQSGINIGTSGLPVQIIAGFLNAKSGSSGIFVKNSGTGTLELQEISTYGTLGGFNLNSTSSAQITDNPSYNIIIPGTTTITAGPTQEVVFLNSNNDFGTVTIASALNVDLSDVNAITISTSTISGCLCLSAGTTVTFTGTTSITDYANITAGNDIQFNGSTTIGGSLDIFSINNGNITQSAAITVTGPAMLQANDITLGATNNDFQNSIDATGHDISLRDINSMSLDQITATGTLSLRIGGSGNAITQSGPISVVNDVTTITAGTSNDVTLNDSDNDFNMVRIASADDVVLSDKNDIVFGDNSNQSVVSGNLTVNAPNGNIYQNTGLNVSTANSITTLNASPTTGNITLNHLNNNFVNLIIGSGNIVEIRDSGGITLGTAIVGTSYSVTAAGTIQQPDDTTIIVPTFIGLTKATGASINLDSIDTVFLLPLNQVQVLNLQSQTSSGTPSNGTLTFYNLNSIQLDEINTNGAFNLWASGITQNATGAVVAGGNAILIAGVNDITLNNATNDFDHLSIASGHTVTIQDANDITIGTSTSTISGDFSLQTHGSILQSGRILVSGESSFNPNNNSITLTNLNNDFNIVGVTNGANVNIRDVNAMQMDNVSATGALTLRTTNGNLTQLVNTSITANGLSTLNAVNADIDFNNSGNDFNIVTVPNVSTRTNNVNLRDDISGIDLGTFNINGNLSVTSNGGDITQSSGTLTIPGSTTLFSGSNDITLTSSTNNFTGDVIITGANNASLRDTNLLSLGAADVVGTYTLTADNGISQTDRIKADTLIATTLNPVGADITLTDSNNDVSTLNLSSKDSTGTSNTPGILSYTDANGFDIAALDTTATINLIGLANITQSGPINADTLNAMTLNNLGADITLADNNEVATLNLSSRDVTNSFNTAGNITYTDASGFDIAGLNTTGNVNLMGSGDITQSGPISATGSNSTIAAIGANIVLSENNDFGTLGLNGINVTINDINDIVLGLSFISGSFDLTTNGTITQNDLLFVGSDSYLDPTGSSILLDNPNNDFGDLVAIPSASSATLVDVNQLGLGDVNITGLFKVTSGGLVFSAGIIQAGSLDSTSVGGAIYFNNFSPHQIGSFTAVNNGGPIVLINSSLTPFILNDITQSNGAIFIENIGPMTLASGKTILTQNQFDSVLLASSDDLTIDGSILTNNGSVFLGAFDLGTLTVTGTVATGGQGVNDPTEGSINLFAENPNQVSNALVIKNTANLSTLSGPGGTLSLDGGVDLNSVPHVGSSDIILQGNGLDLMLNSNLSFDYSVELTALRDVTINAAISTTDTAHNLTIISDSDQDGSGGVTVNGSLNSAADLSIYGSDHFALGGAGLTAGGNILIVGQSVGNADIVVDAPISTSGVGSVTLSPFGTGLILLNNNINTAGGLIDFNKAVTLNANVNLNTGIGSGNAINFNDSFDGNGFNLSLQNGSNANGAVNFNDDANIFGLTTFSQPYTINFYGDNTTFNENNVFNNTGGESIRGILTSNGNHLTFGQVTLIDDANIYTNDGILNMASLTGPYDINIDTGIGDLSIGVVGQSGFATLSPRLTHFTANDITIAQGVLVQGPLHMTGRDISVGQGVLVQGALTMVGQDVTIGEGVQVQGPLNMTGRDIGIGQDVQVQGSLNMTGRDIGIGQDVQVQGSLNMTGRDIRIGQDVSVQGALNMTGEDLTVAQGVLVLGPLNMTGHDITIGQNVSVQGTFDMTGHHINIGKNALAGGALNITGNVITIGKDVLALGALYINGDLVNLFGGTIAAPSITLGSSAAQQVILKGDLILVAEGSGLVVNAKVDGEHSLFLIGGGGPIEINAIMGSNQTVNLLEVLSFSQFTTNADIFVNTYAHHSREGIATFNSGNLAAGGLTVYGQAYLDSSVANGYIHVGGLTINLHQGMLWGQVQGLSGIPAILTMRVLNPVVPNQIFFDGIDIYLVWGRHPFPHIPPQDILPVYYYPQNFKFESEYEALLGMYDEMFFVTSLDGDCLLVSPGIKICGWHHFNN